jgi:ribosomal protein L40E
MKITVSPFEGAWQSRDISPSGMFTREDILVFSDNKYELKMKINNLINGAEKGVFTYTDEKITLRPTHGFVNSSWEEAKGRNAQEKTLSYKISQGKLTINNTDKYTKVEQGVSIASENKPLQINDDFSIKAFYGTWRFVNEKNPDLITNVIISDTFTLSTNTEKMGPVKIQSWSRLDINDELVSKGFSHNYYVSIARFLGDKFSVLLRLHEDLLHLILPEDSHAVYTKANEYRGHDKKTTIEEDVVFRSREIWVCGRCQTENAFELDNCKKCGKEFNPPL